MRGVAARHAAERARGPGDQAAARDAHYKRHTDGHERGRCAREHDGLHIQETAAVVGEVDAVEAHLNARKPRRVAGHRAVDHRGRDEARSHKRSVIGTADAAAEVDTRCEVASKHRDAGAAIARSVGGRKPKYRWCRHVGKYGARGCVCMAAVDR